jgi:hypothetical protein
LPDRRPDDLAGGVEHSIARQFSLVDGGPLRRLARSLGVLRRPLGGLGPGVALAVITWVPLLLLTAGQALGAGDPRIMRSFIESVSVHARLLVAIPLFFGAEAWIDPRLRHFVQHLIDARLVPPAETGVLERAVRTVSRLRDSVLAEAVILAFAALSVATGLGLEQPADAAYWRATEGALTWAGWWHVVVALPVFQFLVARWLWRVLVWWWFLWRLSRLDLELIPVHPDLTGGLNHLGVVETHFGALSIAFSAALAGNFVEAMWFGGATLDRFLMPVVGLVALNLVLFVGPLLCFGPRLLAVKRKGLREYSLLGSAYARDFDAKWVHRTGPAGEPLLGSADIQSLADLSNAFGVIRSMRVVPIRLGLVVGLIVATLAPFSPLLLIAFPVNELVLKILGLLLGG